MIAPVPPKKRRVRADTMPPPLGSFQIIEELVPVPDTEDFHKHPAFDGYWLLVQPELADRAKRVTA